MKQTLFKSPRSERKGIEMTYLFWFIVVTLLVVLIFFANKISKVDAQDLNSSELLPSYYTPSQLGNVFDHKDKRGLLHPVTLVTIDSTKSYLVYTYRVENILKELDIDTDKYKPVENLDLILKFPFEIKLIKLSSTLVSETEDVPAIVRTTENTDLEMGITNVVQEGQDGKSKIVKKLDFEDNSLVKTSEVKRNVISEMKPKIVEKGTKPHEITVDGEVVKYCDSIDIKATMYDSNCTGCSGITYLGYPLEKGIVAVDPNVIPLRTKMYIPGYGYAQALDIGGGIKGNIVDLGYRNFAEEGVKPYTRWTTAYIMCEN